jgi:hypothetical protein
MLKQAKVNGMEKDIYPRKPDGTLRDSSLDK